MQRSERHVVAISPFGVSPEHSHSLLDDQFFFEYLVRRGRDFVFHAPQCSLDLLGKMFPGHEHRLRLLPAPQDGWPHLWRLCGDMQVRPDASVVFFGYSEKLVAAFVSRHALTSFRLTLVATNNFSARRVRLYRGRLRLFLRLIRSKLQRLVVHTDYELSLIGKVDGVSGQRAISKRHHLMLPMSHGEVRLSTPAKPVIAFFGPVKPEKPIEPLVGLLSVDTSGRFDYRAYGLTDAQGELLKSHASSAVRLETYSGRMTNLEYAQAVASADIVLLTHNSDFEGKLSGNLCDCIAHKVPFLGSAIEPHLEYLRRFGPIGYVLDMTNGLWPTEFLRSFTRDDLLIRRGQICTAAATFSKAAIHEDLDRCIG